MGRPGGRPGGLAGCSYDRDVAIEVDIDRDACMGSGNCVYEAVGAFDLDEDGIAIVVDLESVAEAKLESAARNCPTHTITVRRDGVTLR